MPSGRCARAGRTGVAYSLVSRDESPYLVDLHLFLGRPLCMVGQGGESEALVGCVPSEMLEEQHSEVLGFHETRADIVSNN